MLPSRTGQANVPNIPTQNPSVLAAAPANVALRVVVRNTGAAPVRICVDSASLNNQNASDYYLLPAAASETFVIAGGQSLYAGAVGATGTLSFHWNEALPLQKIG